MHKAVRYLAGLLDALESVGQTLNLAKSAAMLKAVDPQGVSQKLCHETMRHIRFIAQSPPHNQGVQRGPVC